MTHYVNVSDIIIPPERQREDIPQSHLDDLEDGFCSAVGMMQPIILRDDGKTLVAGECRLRTAMQIYEKEKRFTHGGDLVPDGCIPFIPLGELTEEQLFEAELDENIKRKDLTWQERTRAIARLAELRQVQAASKGERSSVRDVAAEILGIECTDSGAAQKEVREAKVLADYLDDEEIKKAKSKKDAIKIVEKRKAAEHRARLAAEFQASTSASRFPHTLICGRMEEEIIELPSGSYDGIITDPPYGVDADKFSEQADARHEYEDTKDYAFSLYEILAREGARICKPDAHLYTFLDIGYFYEISDIFRAHGWTCWYRPLVWFKGNNSGMLPAPDYGPRNTYEGLLYCRRGGRKTRCVGPDVLSVPALSRPTFGAQKPVALYEEIASRSFDPGDKIVDPFCGAGGIFRAGRSLSLSITGIELNTAKVDYIYSTYEGDEE